MKNPDIDKISAKEILSYPEIKQFKGRFERRRAFVVGNGPSLGKTKLDLLTNEITFGSNAIALIFSKTNWRPNVYSCIDLVVLIDRLKEIENMRRKMPETQFFFPKHLPDDSKPSKPVDVQKLLLPNPNTTFFDSVPYRITDNAFTSFSPDLERYFFHGTTVTITLIHLAVLMGCNPIYLIGCDTNYIIPQNVKELNPDADRVDKILMLDEDNDPNHFDPNYFGNGRPWHSPNTHLMIEQYKKVKEACDHRGFQIYNATIGGKLDVFPRVVFDSLF